jgi:hypothetical protein
VYVSPSAETRWHGGRDLGPELQAYRGWLVRVVQELLASCVLDLVRGRGRVEGRLVALPELFRIGEEFGHLHGGRSRTTLDRRPRVHLSEQNGVPGGDRLDWMIESRADRPRGPVVPGTNPRRADPARRPPVPDPAAQEELANSPFRASSPRPRARRRTDAGGTARIPIERTRAECLLSDWRDERILALTSPIRIGEPRCEVWWSQLVWPDCCSP